MLLNCEFGWRSGFVLVFDVDFLGYDIRFVKSMIN